MRRLPVPEDGLFQRSFTPFSLRSAEGGVVLRGDGALLGDHEAHAPGKVCEVCGQVIAPGQDVRRRADGEWMHEVCPDRI